MSDSTFMYNEIIGMSHHVSLNRRPMSLYGRAAQFAPFAALTGYEEALDEKRRLSVERFEMPADEQPELNNNEI